MKSHLSPKGHVAENAKSCPNGVTYPEKASLRNMGKRKFLVIRVYQKVLKLSKIELKYKNEQPLKYPTYCQLKKTLFTF